MSATPHKCAEWLSLQIEDDLTPVASPAGDPVHAGFCAQLDEDALRLFGGPCSVLVAPFSTELDDHVVVFVHCNAEKATQVTQAVTQGIAQLIGGPHAQLGERIELEDIDRLQDMAEPLLGEQAVTFRTPLGDVLTVFGSGLLERARDFAPVDPKAARAAQKAEDDAPLPSLKLKQQSDADFAANDAFQKDELGGFQANDAFEKQSHGGFAANVPSAPQGQAGLRPDRRSADQPEGAEVVHLHAVAAQSPEQAADADARDRWSQLLSGVDVAVTVDLGSTEMRLGSLSDLEDDSVLTLDQSVEEAVPVYVNGALYATGRLVVIDDEYGVEIIEVLKQPLVGR